MMLLTLLLLIPFLGALLITLLPGDRSSDFYRRVCVVVLSVQCLASVGLLVPFDASEAGLQLVETFAWLPSIGLDYALAVDGLSMPLVLMNGVLCLVSALASRQVENRPRIYFALLLVISGAVNGAFLAQNLLLFFIFYELELIPLWMLIAVWGVPTVPMHLQSFSSSLLSRGCSFLEHSWEWLCSPAVLISV